MYYLQSRYYDPEVCRFINADESDNLSANGDFASLNLYVYCGNNPVAREDDGGEAWHIAIGAAVGAIAGVAGQLVSDLVTSGLKGEWTFSSWQTYAGAAVGGAVSGVVLAATGNVQAANFASGFFTTSTTQVLEKVSGRNDRSWSEIAWNSARDGTMGLLLGEAVPGVKGITSGRNSNFAVYKGGLTRIRNGNANKMSIGAMAKGLEASIVGGRYLDVYYGLMQCAS